MGILLSTKLKNELLGNKSLRELLQGTVLKIYSGTVPASADAPVSGTLLCTLTNNGATFTKHKIKISLSNLGTNNNITLRITINNIPFTVNTLVVNGACEFRFAFSEYLSSFIGIPFDTGYTPSVTVSNPLFSNIGSITSDGNPETIYIEGAIPGVPLDVSAVIVSQTGNATLTVTEEVPCTGGFRFEQLPLIENGILEKVPTDIWSGTVLVTGTATFARLCFNDDIGEASTNKIRLQGVCGTSITSDFRLTHINLTQGETITCNNFAVRIL